MHRSLTYYFCWRLYPPGCPAPPVCEPPLGRPFAGCRLAIIPSSRFPSSPDPIWILMLLLARRAPTPSAVSVTGGACHIHITLRHAACRFSGVAIRTEWPGTKGDHRRREGRRPPWLGERAADCWDGAPQKNGADRPSGNPGQWLFPVRSSG